MLKQSKKTKPIYITIGIVAVILLGYFIFSPPTNQDLLDDMMKQLTDAVEYSNGVTLVEKQSEYGKLIGNGNGIQFFGTVLVQAEDETQVQALAQKIQGDFEEVGWLQQGDRIIDIKYAKRAHLQYQTDVTAGKYYTVWFYNSHHPDSNLNDVKGH